MRLATQSPGHWLCTYSERGPLVLCVFGWAPPLHELLEVSEFLQRPDFLRSRVHRASHPGTGDQAPGSDGEAEAAEKEVEEEPEPR